MQVIQDRQAHCAIVVSEAPDKFALLTHDANGQVALILHPITWGESPEGDMNFSGEPRKDDTHWQFWEFWHPLKHKEGLYPVDQAARRFLAGIDRTGKLLPDFGTGALEALAECLPHGAVHLFLPQGGFIGRFAEGDDAKLLAKCYRERAIIFGSPADLKTMDSGDLFIVQTHIEPGFKWSHNRKKLHQEIYDMSTRKAKTTPKKVAKVEASRKRADGPVAKARSIYDKLKASKATRGEMIAAAIAEGVNKSTANTQYGYWRRENNYDAPKDAPKEKKAKTAPATKKKTTTKTATAPASTAPAAKKKSKPAGKKKRAAPAGVPTPTPSTPAAAAEQEQQSPTGAPSADGVNISTTVGDGQSGSESASGADTESAPLVA